MRMKSLARVMRALSLVVLALVHAPLQAPRHDQIPAAGPGQAAIASAYPLASEAGKQILAKGGNAFDAAVAVAAALAVVEPSSSGLGGGGFFLLRRASDGLETMIDLREMAPGAATRDMYLDKDGNADRRVCRATRRWPRAFRAKPAGFAHLAKKYGKLPLSVSLAPAIKLAREGFPLLCAPARRHGSSRRTRFSRRPTPTRVYLVQRRSAASSATSCKQPELAASLELLATQGRRRFLQGRVREEARRRRAAARRQLDRSRPG